MTLLEELPRGSFRERSIPVLETKRLTLRAPTLKDTKAVAVLANDRRIAENSARIPHPYNLADAESFIAGANKADGETVFLSVQNEREFASFCDRVLRAGGPALLFENPTGFDMPVLGNLFGTPKRVALGMGADEVSELREIGTRMGFAHVEASPLTRSSYHARQAAETAVRVWGRIVPSYSRPSRRAPS